ncbi:MAG: outer membrane protein assembly factor BamD [Planctomycetota bacterium]|jgi:outer membrane protein assembly factor BamD (BamD/ComL family)|nr:MAG: outer membrane protein assembly factor BamD [Planctomycetota bacterium]
MAMLQLDRLRSLGLRSFGLRPFGLGTGATIAAAALLAVAVTGAAFAQAERYELDALDRWKKVADVAPGSEEAQLLAARRALVDGEPARAQKLANAFLERYPLSRYRADALLVRGDSKRGSDEYEALFDYEEVCRRYAGSEVFVPALEREYEIATLYAKGLRRRFFGTFRIVDTSEDAQELLIRVQERMPGSDLGERACMTLSDYYFDRREMLMAAESYRIFIENYPRSPQVSKARLRLIYAYLAGFRGPEYDASGLLEARAKLRSLQAMQPGLAQQIGAESILVRIEESEAAKFLATASWYLEVDDPISAELFIRRLVQRHPRSIATIEALRIVPTFLAKLPKTILDDAPDYHALRKALLGIDWDAMPADPTATETAEEKQ